MKLRCSPTSPYVRKVLVVAIGCALDYLDFRLPELDWRAGRPALADWAEAFAERPAMRETRPPAPA